MPPALTHDNSRAQRSEIVNLPPSYAYSQTAFPCAEFFNLDVSAQDSHHHTDFDPDMLTDEGTSTSWYTICCVVMQLTSILNTGAAYGVNLQVRMSIDRKTRDVGDYYFIFLCIIKEQRSDEEECQ